MTASRCSDPERPSRIRLRRTTTWSPPSRPCSTLPTPRRPRSTRCSRPSVAQRSRRCGGRSRTPRTSARDRRPAVAARADRRGGRGCPRRAGTVRHGPGSGPGSCSARSGSGSGFGFGFGFATVDRHPGHVRVRRRRSPCRSSARRVAARAAGRTLPRPGRPGHRADQRDVVDDPSQRLLDTTTERDGPRATRVVGGRGPHRVGARCGRPRCGRSISAHRGGRRRRGLGRALPCGTDRRHGHDPSPRLVPGDRSRRRLGRAGLGRDRRAVRRSAPDPAGMASRLRYRDPGRRGLGRRTADSADGTADSADGTLDSAEGTLHSADGTPASVIAGGPPTRRSGCATPDPPSAPRRCGGGAAKTAAGCRPELSWTSYSRSDPG